MGHMCFSSKPDANYIHRDMHRRHVNSDAKRLIGLRGNIGNQMPFLGLLLGELISLFKEVSTRGHASLLGKSVARDMLFNLLPF